MDLIINQIFASHYLYILISFAIFGYVLFRIKFFEKITKSLDEYKNKIAVTLNKSQAEVEKAKAQMENQIFLSNNLAKELAQMDHELGVKIEKLRHHYEDVAKQKGIYQEQHEQEIIEHTKINWNAKLKKKAALAVINTLQKKAQDSDFETKTTFQKSAINALASIKIKN